MNVTAKVLLLLMSLLVSACAVDPYFHGQRAAGSAPSLASAELIWSRDTAQKLAYRPRGGAVISDDFAIPLVNKKGVDVKTLINRLEAP